jgi:hypothetical protein
MPFSIAFQEEPLLYPCEDRRTPAAGGVSVLGNTNEHFIASLCLCSKGDYQRQWRHAVAALLHGKDRAALITEYLGPEIATHPEWWPMYLAGTRFSSKISSFSVTSCREHFRSRMHFHSCATAKQKTRQEGRFLSGA